MLLQYPDDLLFRIPALLHLWSSPSHYERTPAAIGRDFRGQVSTSLISSTIAAKPPAWSSKSVAFNVCSSRGHGLSVTFCLRSAKMRSQSSRFSTMFAAAADSGESASLTSTQAQAAPDCVIAARAESPKDVLPVDATP